MLGEIHNENATLTMDRMPDEFVDLTVTSPPYDKLRKYKGYAFDFEAMATGLWRVTKKGGVVVWVVGDETKKGSESGTSMRQALFFMSLGFNLHDSMIYKKTSVTLNHNRYEQEWEYMFVFSKGKPNTFNPIMTKCLWYNIDSDRTGQQTKSHDIKGKRLKSNGDRGNIKPEKIKGNIWEYNVGYLHSTKDKIAFKHPAIFPEQLATDHILSWTNEGDVVYDPMGGSGTTIKMAHMLRRKWLMSEISPEYCDIAKERIKPIETSIFV